jgi:hypothetical protein
MANAGKLHSTDGNAKLGPENSTGGAGYITFKYNPAAIVISHTAPMVPSAARTPNKNGAPDANTPPTQTVYAAKDPEGMAAANGFTTIGIRSLTFDGPAVAQDCLQLLTWTQFTDDTDKSTGKKDILPRLKFIWGTAQVYLVTLNQATVNYTRFSQTGKPVRAVVDLTLHSIPKIPGPTNPSSGGLAGRRSHLLIGAETLPELATKYYGGPGRWREIAAANGVEDPLRVRPGTRVYLPSTQEAGR